MFGNAGTLATSWTPTVVLERCHFLSCVPQLQQDRRDAELRAKREEEEQRKRREEKRRQAEELKREEELLRRKQVGRSCWFFLIFLIQFKLESDHRKFCS